LTDAEKVLHSKTPAGVRNGIEHPGNRISSKPVAAVIPLEKSQSRPSWRLMFSSAISDYGVDTNTTFVVTGRAKPRLNMVEEQSGDALSTKGDLALIGQLRQTEIASAIGDLAACFRQRYTVSRLQMTE
jgi:hypothetical protein